MNGVHDMGGMHGMGPVAPEQDEPVFHADWEKRVFALNRAMGAWGKWNIDASRHQRELIPAPEYLRMSYYERFFDGLIELAIRTGLVTREEIASGQRDPATPKLSPALTGAMVSEMVSKGSPTNRNVPAKPGFKTAQRVRAKNMNPSGHTRLPRYTRGKQGVIHRDHGVFVFPDTNAHFQGEKPQHLYSVRFEAVELWGPGAAACDAVYIDLWEDYLEKIDV
jgi:nitrile hydratase subunit beta